ncbi:D-alanyl-D-alanine carboxypeptidase family protein [Oxalobacter formigenes]|nr:D-alanyl-D-alanine carboxypeptidase family protein [Oxalobacter formigenes]ARQ45017.1 D-alanyl-D-alanine carboxypeptidase DacC [Oxalobacter formigenes]ARQ77333.1 peptidase [Oxalobacter formigenes OXCC13]MCZ4063252.1 D-alanyl-D-alanine carboxypeptidase [Oxalobacter formigenes]QDX32131.1 D-alanyl-D-alanine carboxypeptidase [Oxalobacter formigenes]WAW01719.1 D-alanyl-D-alanine carboxypeptidase [Oxalobacter formigenes]
MKKSKFVVLFLFFWCFLFNVHAAGVAAPTLTSRSWLLIDVVSNQVLASSNSQERIRAGTPARLMTAYLVFGAIKDGKLNLDKTVSVSDEIGAMESGGPRMFLQPGSSVTIQQLLDGLIVQGSEDAALTLALAVSGDEKSFVDLMNREAVRLGMKSTNFTHPYETADKDSYSTPNDLSVLAVNLMRDYPDYYSGFSTREFTYNKITQRNPNRLLWVDPTVDGLVASAGVRDSMVVSARRDSILGERRMLSVVVGAVSDQARAQESLKLLNWGFQNFDTIRLYEKNQVVASPEVWKGSSGDVDIGFNVDTYVSVPKGEISRLKTVLERNDPLIAPINEGSQVGVLKILVGDKVIAELPVLALEQINVASFLGIIWDTIRLWFK